MADAELTLRATLDDDASRGIDNLESKVAQSARSTTDANKAIGRSAANAARETGQSAGRIATAYQNASRAASGFARATASAVSSKARSVLSGQVQALGRLRDGYRSAGAAASSFSGKAGSIGGALRKITDSAKRAIGGLKSLGSTAAAQGREIGSKLVAGVKSKMGSLQNTVKNGLKTAALVAGAAVGAAFVMQLGAAVKNAGALEQSMGAIQAVFKDNAGQMVEWSNTAATTVGLSKLEYQELATLIGAQLKNGGTAMDELNGKTNDLLTVGADLSSMFGGTTREAVEALNSALRGENNPIERYGVTLTAAKVEAEALAMGAEKVNGELSTQAKQAAILSLIQKQTQDSTGNFAREMDTFSGSIQILKARWADLTTQWAGYVLPILGRLISFIGGPVMDALEGMTNGLGAFFTFLNEGSTADFGVLSGFELAAQNAGIALHDMLSGARDGFSAAAEYARDFASSVDWPAVAGWFLDIWQAVSPLGPALQGFAQGAGEGFTQLGITVGQAIGLIAPALVPVIAGLAQVVAKILELVGPTLPVLIPLIGGTVLAFKALTGVVAGVKLVAGAISLIPVALRLIGPALYAVPLLGWIALAISALVLMYQKVGWFRDGVNAAWEWLKTATKSTVDFFVNTWRTGGDTITRLWESIRTAVSTAVTWVSTTATALWDGAARAIGTATTWLKDAVIMPVWNSIRFQIALVVGVLLTLWDGMVWVLRNTLGPGFTWLRDSVIIPVWNGIRTAIDAAWAFIRNNIFNPLMSFIRGPLTNTWNFLQSLVDTVWNAIRTSINNAWNWVRNSVLNPAISFVRGPVTDSWNWLRSLVDTVWAAIRATISDGWNWVRNNVLQPAINFIRGPITDGWNWLRDTVSRVWTSIRDTISQGWTTIRTTVFDPLVRFVRDTIPNAFSAAKDAISRVWSGVKDTIGRPINDAVALIKNVLIGNINKVLSHFQMPTINIGWTSVGGGFRDGGYTGAGHPGAPAGIVHRDEHVIRSASRRSIEHEAPGYLEALNRKGAAALGAAAPGAPVYGGRPSFTGGLTQQVFNAGRLNVSGSAPGYDLAGAIRMVDNATRVKVAAGGGAPNVNVSAGNYADWWAGYFSGNSIRLNNRVAGGMNPASKRVLVAHEIGHALGLPHSDPSGLQSMMSYANMYNHNSVTSADVAALSAIYGGTGFASGGGFDFIGLLMSGIEKALESLASRFVKPLADMVLGATKHLIEKAKEFVTGRAEQDTGAGAVPALQASRGLVLGGYSPRTDSVPIMASRGESVLVPELTRALGGRNIEAANLSASGSRAGGVEKALSLLGGRPGGGGGGVVVQMDITVQGNADQDALSQLREELEDALNRILEENVRRGY